ncbi:30S ribosomal protein S21 [Salinibacter ruber]|uniref:30S ribosomal protein S21 n=1 Tax=Salinibacter ruber TaxID=146919 RepID=UPI002073D689|nr:30S ribosomal protein S21 [Salinibacter ruber]
MQQRLEAGNGFDGYRVDDQPYVTEEEGDVDDMLDELGRRVHKNGRLDEYEDNLRHTKPSEQRRNERQAQAHRANNDKDRRQWRGGVRD